VILAKLRPDTAAQVAAQLTVARASLLGGMLAGRLPGAAVTIDPRTIEEIFLHYLAFASEVDPKSAEVGATLDLTLASILPE
jgi:hypothetical protein